MPQEPNINLDKIKRINDPVMPVPRKNSKRLAENLDPNEQRSFWKYWTRQWFCIKNSEQVQNFMG